MGREVRMVPPGWEHPTRADGEHIPLLDGLGERLAEWHRYKAMYDLGYVQDYTGRPPYGWKRPDAGEAGMPFEEWYGGCPEPDDYMPDWDASVRTLFQMYENVSEGTPISPAFETPEELARWLADNNASAFGRMTATYDQWLSTIKEGWAPSAVFTSSGGLQSGVALMKES